MIKYINFNNKIVSFTKILLFIIVNEIIEKSKVNK